MGAMTAPGSAEEGCRHSAGHRSGHHRGPDLPHGRVALVRSVSGVLSGLHECADKGLVHLEVNLSTPCSWCTRVLKRCLLSGRNSVGTEQEAAEQRAGVAEVLGRHWLSRSVTCAQRSQTQAAATSVQSITAMPL
eukprot:3178694-Rhodomonas_salina.1